MTTPPRHLIMHVEHHYLSVFLISTLKISPTTSHNVFTNHVLARFTRCQSPHQHHSYSYQYTRHHVNSNCHDALPSLPRSITFLAPDPLCTSSSVLHLQRILAVPPAIRYIHPLPTHTSTRLISFYPHQALFRPLKLQVSSPYGNTCSSAINDSLSLSTNRR